jgi:hypothetical protein
LLAGLTHSALENQSRASLNREETHVLSSVLHEEEQQLK